MTWQQHLKKCAKEWREMKKNAAAKPAKPVPPALKRRIRGKQSDPNRDVN